MTSSAEGFLILDDGSTEDKRKVKVNAHYAYQTFSISVEPDEGYSPNKIIDSVEIIGL